MDVIKSAARVEQARFIVFENTANVREEFGLYIRSNQWLWFLVEKITCTMRLTRV